MKAKDRRELKVSFKRAMIYMAIIFPVVLLCSLGFSLMGIESSALIIFMNVIIGATLAFLLEVNYLRKQDRMATENKTKVKKPDPFAD